MSKYNNVNPDHYKVAGRERPGKAGEPRNRRGRWINFRTRREYAVG